MNRIVLSSLSPDTVQKNSVEIELKDRQGYAALDPLHRAVHGHAVKVEVQLRQKVYRVLHLDDLVHEEGGLPLGLLIGYVQEPPDVILVVGGVMLREEMSKEALRHMPHLGAVPSEGDGGLNSC